MIRRPPRSTLFPYTTPLPIFVLAIVHLLASKMRFLDVTPRSVWLSIAGGISVAYVFVHLLPDLAEEQQTIRSEEHTSELQSRQYLVCRLLLEKKIIQKYRLRK